MQTARKNAAQMAVILPHNFVLLKVPTLDLFVLSDRKEVWRAFTQRKGADCVNVAGKCEQTIACDEVPQLDGLVG